MKRILIMIFFVIVMSVSFSTSYAINLDDDGPHRLADYMQGSTQLYVATRIGADFIAELDMIIMTIADKLPDSLEIPPYSLADVLRAGLADEGLDWDEISALLGDYVAVGAETDASLDFDDEGLFTIIVEITDQQAVDDLINRLLQDAINFPEPVMDGDRIVYQAEGEGKLMITPTLLIFTNNMDYTPNADPPLSSNPEFKNALSTLPADNYLMLAYVSETLLEMAMSQGDAQELQAIGFDPQDMGSIVAGFTILDGSVFTFDASIQTMASMSSDSVSIDFLSALPATTDGFAIGTNLTGIYNNTLSIVRDIAQETGGDDPSAEIESAFLMTGLDLQDDVLSWTTGNFGVFWGSDPLAMLESLILTDTVSNLELDAGLVIEATDVDKAQNLADQLGQLISQFVGSEEGITVTQEDGITRIILELPNEVSPSPMDIELILTATEEFFYLGTASAFDKILSGDTLASDPDFVKASEYFVDNPTSVFYGNADGTIMSFVPNLLILSGPAIGNVYENVVIDLDNSSSQMMIPTPTLAVPTEAPAIPSEDAEETAEEEETSGGGFFSSAPASEDAEDETTIEIEPTAIVAESDMSAEEEESSGGGFFSTADSSNDDQDDVTEAEIVTDADSDRDSDMDDALADAMAEEAQIFLDALSAFDDILSSMTFTTSVDETGVVRLRGIIALNQ